MPTHYVYVTRTEGGHLTFMASTAEQLAETARTRGVWQVEAANATEAIAAILMQAADQYLGPDVTITRLVPRERTNDEKLDAARNILRADYWDDVRSVVADVKDEIEQGNLTDSDQVTEYLEEWIDGTHRVIYTYAAMEAVIFSDNDGAYEEHFGSEGMVEDGVVQWSRLAYCAMLADVRDQLGDIDELLAEAQKQCYLCDKSFTEDDDTEVAEYGGVQQRTHVECPEEEEDQ